MHIPPLFRPSSGLLSQRHAAAAHVERRFGRGSPAALDTARAAACYDVSMLAYGYHERLSAHAAAMTAACLLALAVELEYAGEGPALEPEVPAGAPDTATLERDAAMLGGPRQRLTQARLARALGHFEAAVGARGLNLAACLSRELGSGDLAAVAPALLAAHPPPCADSRAS